MTPRESNAAGSSTSQVRSSIDIPPDLVLGLLGSADENLRALERILAADLHVRGNTVTLGRWFIIWKASMITSQQESFSARVSMA